MKNEVLEYLKNLIEEKYGDLDDDGGCYATVGYEREWLSVKRIMDLLREADEEYYGDDE